jgi:hypothetical protein
VFAIADTVWKYYYHTLLFIILCTYTIATFITIVIVSVARHELISKSYIDVQAFNNSPNSTAVTSGHEGIPRYPMTVNVEKV